MGMSKPFFEFSRRFLVKETYSESGAIIVEAVDSYTGQINLIRPQPEWHLLLSGRGVQKNEKQQTNSHGLFKQVILYK